MQNKVKLFYCLICSFLWHLDLSFLIRTKGLYFPKTPQAVAVEDEDRRMNGPQPQQEALSGLAGGARGSTGC